MRSGCLKSRRESPVSRGVVLGCAITASIALLAGCSGSDPSAPDDQASGQTTAPTTTKTRSTAEASLPAGVTVLPLGKDDLALDEGIYRSPEGFEPTLQFELTPGWMSVHRYADGFDLARPGASGGPDVIVAVLEASEATVKEALDAVRARATGSVTDAVAKFGQASAAAIDVTGGTGELVVSTDGSIALDAAEGQRTRVIGVSVASGPLLFVVLVPDSSRWDAVTPLVDQFLASVNAV